MSLTMLSVLVTVQPPCSNRCFAVSASPVVDVLFSTISGMGWLLDVDELPVVVGCFDGDFVTVFVEVGGVAVTVDVEVRRDTGLAWRPLGCRNAIRATTATAMPSTASKLPLMRS